MLWFCLLAKTKIIGLVDNNGCAPILGGGFGPVGATIVAEVLIGLFELDERSFLGADRSSLLRENWNTLSNCSP
ncbi:MAG: hypothetical protein AAF941_05940 [Pseudomonadota bacterium]